ncbi:hypothetical protein FHG87_019340 [Trinorchestia longiramus]|nr:hypothetical protein FHG87_019340 [Trinorchestia longiramus]
MGLGYRPRHGPWVSPTAWALGIAHGMGLGYRPRHGPNGSFLLPYSILFSGWVSVGTAFTAGYIGLGIFLLLVAMGATADAAGMIILLLWVHRIYRSTGASFAKAQAEFTQGVMRNEHVQSATANAASSIVRNQFGGNNSAASSATTPTSDPRF